MKDSGSCFWLIPKPPNNFSTLFYPLFFQVTSEADVSQAIKLANEKFGPLTVAVNCAGIGIAMRTLSKKGVHPLNQFEKVLKVNFCFSPFLLSKYKDVLYKLSSRVYIDAVYLVSFMTRQRRLEWGV